MAKEGWTKRQILILIIIALIALAVGIIVPNLVKNYCYQNNEKFIGELATSWGCPTEDKDCLKDRCETDCDSAASDCFNSCRDSCPSCKGNPCTIMMPSSADKARCNDCVNCRSHCVDTHCDPIQNACLITCDFLYGD